MDEVKPKDFSHLVGKLEGLSDKQIQQHLGLYQGYVKKLNEIRSKLAAIPYDKRKDSANFSYGEFAELKRREAVPYNGTYLHELYFENLGHDAKEGSPSGDLAKAIDRAFGSHSNWQLDLEACGTTATGGWVLLTFDPVDGILHHNQVWEHSNGMMVHQYPVLALDTWEHAFMIDFGTDKGSYMKAFLKNVNWRAANARFARARKAAAA